MTTRAGRTPAMAIRGATGASATHRLRPRLLGGSGLELRGLTGIDRKVEDAGR